MIWVINMNKLNIAEIKVEKNAVKMEKKSQRNIMYLYQELKVVNTSGRNINLQVSTMKQEC